jgi:hypothetical protein
VHERGPTAHDREVVVGIADQFAGVSIQHTDVVAVAEAAVVGTLG